MELGVENQMNINTNVSDDEDSEDDGLLGSTLGGDALARSLADTHITNELGLVRSEVKRLRSKIQSQEQEKDQMVDSFRTTTRILLDRIKELEGELSETKSRPQTAVVLEHLEQQAGPSGKKPPLPQRPRSSGRGSGSARAGTHEPEVLRIEEEPAGSVCGKCGEFVPEGRLVSHNYHCYFFSDSFRCVGCDEVLPLSEKESHLAAWTDPSRLIESIGKKDIDTVRAMVEHGLDLSTCVEADTGDTALHAAARLGDAQLIGFCMGYGVDINPCNVRGDIPLHLAAESGNLQAVQLLVELGADLNNLNAQGEPALMLACRRGAAKCARLLVEQRADAEACTKLGDTPVQVAQRLGHQDTVLALAMAGVSLRSGTPSRVRSNSPMRRLNSGGSLSNTGFGSGGLGSSGGGGGCGGCGGGYPPVPRSGSRKNVSVNAVGRQKSGMTS